MMILYRFWIAAFVVNAYMYVYVHVVATEEKDGKFTACGKKFESCLKNDGNWENEVTAYKPQDNTEGREKQGSDMYPADDLPCPDIDLDEESAYQTVTVKGPDNNWITMMKWDHRKGSTVYSVVRAKMDWQSAHDYCKKHGSHLAVFETRLENDVVTDFIRQHPCLQFVDRLWISIRWNGTTWKWNNKNGTKSELLYNNFGKGEPNGMYRNEKCLDLLHKKDFNWNDEPCDRQTIFICEHDLNDKTEDPCPQMQEGYDKLNRRQNVIVDYSTTVQNTKTSDFRAPAMSKRNQQKKDNEK